MSRLLQLAILVLTLIGAQFACDALMSEYAYYIQIIIFIGINIIMAVSLNLINGVTGQFSLGHAGFMAVGAYVSAAMTTFGDAWVVDHLLRVMPTEYALLLWFTVALFAGGIASALVGLLVGLPTLRLRGDYLAIATLGVGEIVRVVILNCDAVGGARGFTGITERTTLWWVYGIAAVSVWCLRNLTRTAKGLGFFAVREDEIAALSIGIPVTRYKVYAFVVGAFFAGIGGGLFAHYMTYLHTNTFSFTKSIEYVAMVVLGGQGSFTGTIIAALLLTALPELLREISDWRMIIYSLLLIAMMLWRREGLFGKFEFSWAWLRGCFTKRRRRSVS